MHRRRFLQAGAGLAAAFVAGCSGSDGGGGTDTPTDASPTATDPPRSTTTTGDGERGVYVQSFRENMLMGGTTTAGEYRVAVLYTFPHRFWTVSGTTVEEVPRTENDAVHLMAAVWDPETGRVLPETGVSTEVVRDGQSVSQEVIYPMLSQRMGFHYGGNFSLPGDGIYTARVSVGGISGRPRRTGAFEGRFGDPATAELDFEFTQETRDRFSSQEIPQAGEPGAVRPMEMGSMPVGRAPPADQLPGTPRGVVRTGDAKLAVTTLSDAPRFGAGGRTYLVVSARTPYNRLVLPAMALSGTLTRDGEQVFDGPLERTLDPDLGYHYGAAVDGVESGDQLELRVDTPPQLARHEGYETAFLDMPARTLSM